MKMAIQQAFDSVPSRRLMTGIESIDREHAQLVFHEGLLAGICCTGQEDCFACEAERRTQCNRQLTTAYEELLGLLIDHFQSEERLMACLPRELAEAHKKEHADLSERLASLARAPRDLPVLTRPGVLHEIVSRWLTEHVTQWDIPLAERLTSRCWESTSGMSGPQDGTTELTA
jgi:hemerythrin-like metal-binding protein